MSGGIFSVTTEEKESTWRTSGTYWVETKDAGRIYWNVQDSPHSKELSGPKCCTEVENWFGTGILNLGGILESFWGDLCPDCTQTD